MQKQSRPDSGMAILPALFVVLVTMGIVFSMTLTSLSGSRAARTQQLALQTSYLAKGGIEIAKKAIQDVVASGGAAPVGGAVTIDGQAVSYAVTALGTPTVQTDASGFQTTTQSYEVAASAAIGGFGGRARRIINVSSTPMFQYAVFFEQGLDILPTPDMVLTGRVHTNGDLRIGCNTGTLTCDSNHIRAVGDIRRWKKHNNIPTVGNVLIRRWVEDPFDPAEPVVYQDMESLDQMTAASIPSTTGYDSLFSGFDENGDGDFDDPLDWLPFDPGSLERYREPAAYPQTGNTLKVGAHGVTRATPPPASSLVMFEGDPTGDYVFDGGTSEYVLVAPGTGTHSRGYYHESADVQITVAADGSSWSAVDSGGFDITAVLNTVVSIDQTYDERQGGYVRVAKIDVAALNTSGGFPINGLVYVSHYGMGTGTDSKGVHLINGAQVSANLTVVTEGSAYIEGDYNTVVPKSSAVLCDGINLLSNSWANGPAKPTASNTTYNVALVIGNTETLVGQYNGGLENFPRFHEDWTGVTCTVVGSMVSIWTNQYATGLVSDARYNPPIRNYGFDKRFNNVSQLPPFTPMVVSVVDLVRY